jgi:hypothetical protein
VPGFDTRKAFINAGIGLPTKNYSGGQMPPAVASLDWKLPMARAAPITIGIKSRYHYGKDKGQELHHIPLAARVSYYCNFEPTVDVYLLGSPGYTFERIDGDDFLSKKKGGGLFTGGGVGFRLIPSGIPAGVFTEFNYNSFFTEPQGLLFRSKVNI